MRSAYFKLSHKRRPQRIGLIVFVMLLCLSFAGYGTNSPVYAVDQQSDGVLAHCLQKVPQKAVEGCTLKKPKDRYAGDNYINIFHARNVATWHCDDKPVDGGYQTECIEREAKKYIDQAVAKNPTGPRDFTNKLTAILEDKGGSLNVPSPRSTTGEQPSTTQCAKDDDLCVQCRGEDCLDSEPDAAACAANPRLEGCSANPNANCDKQNCDFIEKYVNPFINLLSIVFGLIAIISLILGGIQYSASAGDPQKVSNAKGRIVKTIIALVAYLFLYAFIQFLIPGGAFK